jgi:uncharacterized protein (TIGR03437 family)
MMRTLTLVICVGVTWLRAAPPQLGGCPVFPADNVWNAPVDTLPVDANSAAYVATVGASVSLHPDFGSGLYQGAPIGIPYVLVTGQQPKLAVSFSYRDESDAGPYPIPPDAPIEGGPNSTGDRHILMLDRDDCVLYELFAAYPPGGDKGWRAGSGAIFNLRSHALRPDGWTSTDAAGLPVLPGLVRYEEVAAGEIRHAIRLTVPQTRRAYVWPARHYASSLTEAKYPPMGQRFRLRADYDLSGFSRDAQVILQALKKYGMILADNGSAWFISGAPDERWNNERLRELRKVRGSDFEAVDASGLMVDRDSGQVRPGASNPSVVNAASLRAGALAPGELISIFGGGFGAGTRARFDGVAGPLLYAGGAQLNAVVPYAVAGQPSTRMEVESNQALQMAAPLAVAAAAPGLFTLDASGSGQAAVLNPDYSLNSPSNPAAKGAVVMLYGTGEGQTDPPGVDGKPCGEVPPKPTQPVSVRIGGVPAEVLYAGGAPGLVAGVLQVNARIPTQAPSGNAVPVLLTVGGFSSQPEVTLAVR